MKWLSIVLFVFLASCTNPGKELGLSEAIGGKTFDRQGNYLVGPNDTIYIRVIEHRAITGEYVVSQSGEVSIPLVGSVFVAGHSETELKTIFIKTLRPYIKRPKVSVAVRGYNSYKVYIFGDVRNPGVYNFTEKTSILQGISTAGGLNEFASGIIVLHRPDKKGRVLRYKANFDEISAGYKKYNEFVLERGDVLQVD